MQGLQLELASAASFWHLDFPTWNFLATHSWISNTWETIFDSSLDLRGPPIAPVPPRAGDVGLIDFLMELPLSIKTLFRLNNCHLRSKVFWTPDLATVDGTQIHADPWEGRPRDQPDVHD